MCLGIPGEIVEIMTEVIIAPAADEEAIAIVAAKKNLRLLVAGALPDRRAPGLMARSVAGGLLVQSRDNAVVDDMNLKAVTKRAPSPQELADLRFAYRVAKHVKSNAIVYAKNGATVGIGADMIRTGLAASMAKPGGNLTGINVLAGELDVKRLQILHEAVSAAKRIGALALPDRGFDTLPELETAARQFDLELLAVSVRRMDELARGIDALQSAHVDAVNVLASPVAAGPAEDSSCPSQPPTSSAAE